MRKQRARNKKPGARQQRILDKYKDVITKSKSSYSIMDRSKIARSYRKMIRAKGKVEQYKSLMETGPQFLKMTPLEIRKVRDRMFDFQNTFLVEKENFYQQLDKELGDELGIDDEGFLDLTDEEYEIIKEIRDKLEWYRKGDDTITKYYHHYGFNSINDYSIFLYARAEGLL